MILDSALLKLNHLPFNHTSKILIRYIRLLNYVKWRLILIYYILLTDIIVQIQQTTLHLLSFAYAL